MQCICQNKACLYGIHVLQSANMLYMFNIYMFLKVKSNIMLCYAKNIIPYYVITKI